MKCKVHVYRHVLTFIASTVCILYSTDGVCYVCDAGGVCTKHSIVVRNSHSEIECTTEWHHRIKNPLARIPQ